MSEAIRMQQIVTTHLGDAGIGGSSQCVIGSSGDDGRGGSVTGDDVGVRELEERGQIVLLRGEPVRRHGCGCGGGGGEGEVVVVVVDQALGRHLISTRGA